MQELFWDIRLNGEYLGTAPDCLKDIYVNLYRSMNKMPNVTPADHVEFTPSSMNLKEQAPEPFDIDF